MSGFCTTCGMPNCERGHMPPEEVSYGETLKELEKLDGEINDVHKKRAELNRLEELLQDRRREILRRIDLAGPPLATR